MLLQTNKDTEYYMHLVLTYSITFSHINVLFILVIETLIPTEEDLMELGNIRFPPSADDENALRFNNLTPIVEIPADLVVQRIEMEGPVHTYAYIQYNIYI